MRDGGAVYLESGFPAGTAEALAALGHRVQAGAEGLGGFGGYQAILRDPDSGVYSGASESRKDGHAAGY